MRINLSPFRKSKESIPWLHALATEFFNEHDLEFNAKARLWLRSQQGCSTFVEWLQVRNWQATYWELPPLVEEGGTEIFLGYGIKINDYCPEFIAYKLKL